MNLFISAGRTLGVAILVLCLIFGLAQSVTLAKTKSDINVISPNQLEYSETVVSHPSFLMKNTRLYSPILIEKGNARPRGIIIIIAAVAATLACCFSIKYLLYQSKRSRLILNKIEKLKRKNQQEEIAILNVETGLN